MIKNSMITMLLCGIVNLIFEFISYYKELNVNIYSIVIIRYILLISIGIYLYRKELKINTTLASFFGIISFVYIILVHYFNLRFFTEPNWQSSNIYSFGYSTMLFIILMKVLNNKSIINKLKVFIPIGKASFFIFLVQKVYFFILKQVKNIDVSSFHMGIISLFICIILGVFAYYIYNFLNRKIKNIFKRTRAII
ncbi:MAG: hypothetical protein GX275_07575 [Clostridiales bacterium]|nr:hypothetical protein [Clostridiales bacterium]